MTLCADYESIAAAADASIVVRPEKLPKTLDPAILRPGKRKLLSRSKLRYELEWMLGRHRRRCAQVSATPSPGGELQALRDQRDAATSIHAAYCALDGYPNAEFAMYRALIAYATSRRLKRKYLTAGELCWRLDELGVPPVAVIRTAIRLCTAQVPRSKSGPTRNCAGANVATKIPAASGLRRSPKSTYRARRRDAPQRLSEYQLATEAARFWHLMFGERPTYTNYDRLLHEAPPRSASGRFVAAVMCLAEPSLADRKRRSRLETIIRCGIRQAQCELKQCELKTRRA